DITLDEDNGYSVERQFDGSNSDNATEYSWSITETAQSGSGVTQNFTFDRGSPASNTIQLTVKNESSPDHPNGSDTAEVTQTLHDVPNISISPSSDQDINKGDSIIFNSSVRNEFDNAVSYSWKVDGSEESTNANFTRKFDSTGDFTVNLTVNDDIGADSKQLTVSVSSTSSSSSSGGGGGGGGGGGATTTETVEEVNTFPTISSGTTREMSIDEPGKLGVDKISISVKNEVSDVKVTVKKQDGAPSDVDVAVSGKIYRYVDIDVENLNDSDVDEAKIQFSVNRSWIDENNLQEDEVSLKRFHGGSWNKLDTSKLSGSNETVKYEATGPGMSYFAVSGEPKIVENKSEENVTEEGPVCGNNQCESGENWMTCEEDCEKPERVKKLEETIDKLKGQFDEGEEAFQKLKNASQKLAAGNYEEAKKLVD
ncbi:MAG: PGF-pre-PGF domain-containing protein, partial [Candidatus Nanohaloarchaea archaeon]|nr:PGF-pre-PGF domain-containing protein [Candidatus Nanohaloarchaea archaeon]